MSSLNLRIPKEAKEIIEKEAKFEGKSISDYARDLIYEKIEDIEKTRAKLQLPKHISKTYKDRPIYI